MVVQVEVVVVDPHRAALRERHLHDPLPEPRHEVQAARDDRPHVVESEVAGGVEERFGFEQPEGADVLWLRRRLDVQERGVLGGESLVRHRSRPY